MTLSGLKTIFYKMRLDLEFTGLDFKLFFLMMTSVDYIFIYGKKNEGIMNRDVI